MAEKPNYKREPREHQRQALIHSCFQPYYALLMERGTGKTKVVLDTACILYKRKKISALLVIAPNDVHVRWITEHLEKDIHSDILFHAHYWEGTKETKSYVQELTYLLKNDGPLKIFSINVEAFVSKKAFNYCKRFLSERDVLMVVDESTRIKVPKRTRTKRILALSKYAKFRRILTGNEVTNTPFDVYSQMKFLNPGFWGGMSFFVFTHRYGKFREIQTKYKTNKKGETYKFQKLISYQRMGELRQRVNSIAFRARKKDCLELPEKIYSPIIVQLNEDQKKIYKTLRDELFAEYGENYIMVVNKVSLYTRFRQICGGFFPDSEKVIGENPKLKAILYDLEEVDEIAIIWAVFVPELKMLYKEVKGAFPEKKVELYYGQVKKKDRPEIVTRFQNNEIDILIANPEVAGTGLNLQNSCLQYFYSNTFKPEPRWQAEDRSHRDGQHWPVVYKDIIAEKTIDEKIAKSHIAKTNMAEYFSRPIKEVLDGNDF